MWEKIPDYEELYEINENGLIRNAYGKVLSPHFDKDGYLRIDLYKKKKRTKFGVHQLVAKTFISGYFEGAVVNHIDENKQNNHYSNLEWVTVKENTNHGTSIKRRAKTQGKTVAQLDLEGNIIAIYYSTGDAERKTGIDHSFISMAANGKVKTAKGFRWSYVQA